MPLFVVMKGTNKILGGRVGHGSRGQIRWRQEFEDTTEEPSAEKTIDYVGWTTLLPSDNLLILELLDEFTA
jgi:hypothetical protein